jgi:hypothetical protein
MALIVPGDAVKLISPEAPGLLRRWIAFGVVL